MSITIYKQEIADGIGDLVRTTASTAYSVQPTLYNPELEIVNKIKAFLENDKQPEDLFFLNSVLASVGWNANDDVFAPKPTWDARYTPINKPFNYMHTENDIIGHMVASAIAGPDGNIIKDTDNVIDIPEQFDVLVTSVLYKVWADQKLQERMNRIIADISNGKWFVSMECLFGGFDYAVVMPDKSHKVIARNEESAFLTKHLRAYGGSGEYEGHKVGRLLRNFVFSAKGLVDNPANKRSIILNKYVPFNGTTASVKNITKGRKMEPNEILKSQLDEAKKQLEATIAENKELQAKAKKEAEEAFAKKVEAFEKKIADLEKTVSAKDTELATAKEAGTKAEKTVAEKETKIADLEKQIADSKVAAAKAARAAKLAKAGVTGEEADKLVEKFASATDEIFDEFVALKAEKCMDDEKKNKEKEAKAAETSTEDKTGEAAAAAADLAKLEAEKAAAMTADTNKTETLRASASSFIKNSVLKTTAASKSDKK